MKKTIPLLALVLLLCAAQAAAYWKPENAGLLSLPLRCVAMASGDSSVRFAGAKAALYSAPDAAKPWKPVLKLASGGAFVNTVYIDPSSPADILAGTDEGLYASGDGGRKWQRVFRRAEPEEERVWVAHVARDGTWAAGTGAGLFVSSDRGASWRRLSAFSDQRIYQIAEVEGGRHVVASESGLFVSQKRWVGWRSIYRRIRSTPAESASAAESEPAELESSPIFFAIEKESPLAILLFSSKKILWTQDEGYTWEGRGGFLEAAPAGRPVRMNAIGKSYAYPARGGVYVVDAASGTGFRLGGALPSRNVYDLHYDSSRDELLAASDAGFFTMTHPETTLYFDLKKNGKASRVAEILETYRHEPSIQELQEIAMRYAEVHPEKIAAWRAQASRKAWFPALTVGRDWQRDENIDVDRGGTNDPDRFIFGPPEQSSDLSMDLHWDLSNLIWSDDQTSIDNRSKLMVQLRDDLLTQLNHLYFARRRLQLESVMSGEAGLELDIERELQLQEYTAGIDAYTGGYLSRKLAENVTIRSSDPTR